MMRLVGGCAAVIGITLMEMRLFGNFVAVKSGCAAVIAVTTIKNL